MDESTFSLKEPLTNDLLKSLGDKLGGVLGTGRELKCKGIRIYYVDKFDCLMSSGLFVKGFSPEDWDDAND